MSKFKPGDLVKVVHTDYPNTVPVGSVLAVRSVPAPDRVGLYLALETSPMEYRYFYDDEVEPAAVWSVADVKVGDKVRATRVLEGRVSFVYQDGDFEINGDTIWLTNGHTTVDLIEAAKTEFKVGDEFTPGLPVGTVIESVWSRAFKTSGGWTFRDGSSTDEDHFRRGWKIVYLPEA